MRKHKISGKKIKLLNNILDDHLAELQETTSNDDSSSQGIYEKYNIRKTKKSIQKKLIAQENQKEMQQELDELYSKVNYLKRNLLLESSQKKSYNQSLGYSVSAQKGEGNEDQRAAQAINNLTYQRKLLEDQSPFKKSSKMINSLIDGFEERISPERQAYKRQYFTSEKEGPQHIRRRSRSENKYQQEIEDHQQIDDMESIQATRPKRVKIISPPPRGETESERKIKTLEKAINQATYELGTAKTYKRYNKK